MIAVYVNQQRKHPADLLSTISGQVAEAVWSSHATSLKWEMQGLDAGVTIHFMGLDRIRGINRETRGIDKATDVLSFPLLDMDRGRLPRTIRPEDLDRGKDTRPVIWLGDILLCPAAAQRQAMAYGHSFAREIAFLTAHGMLHLLGYDHIDNKGEKTMFEYQERILTSIGYRRDSIEGVQTWTNR
jgi:probable rRNA maturation factor